MLYIYVEREREKERERERNYSSPPVWPSVSVERLVELVTVVIVCTANSFISFRNIIFNSNRWHVHKIWTTVKPERLLTHPPGTTARCLRPLVPGRANIVFSKGWSSRSGIKLLCLKIWWPDRPKPPWGEASAHQVQGVIGPKIYWGGRQGSDHLHVSTPFQLFQLRLNGSLIFLEHLFWDRIAKCLTS